MGSMRKSATARRATRVAFIGACGTLLALMACKSGEEAAPSSADQAPPDVEAAPSASASATSAASAKPEPFRVPPEVTEFLAWVEKARPLVEAGLEPQNDHPEMGRVSCHLTADTKQLYDHGYCTAKPTGSAREFMWPHGKPTVWDAALVVDSCLVELDCAALGKKTRGTFRNQYRELHHCSHTAGQELLIRNVKENDATVVIVFKQEYPVEWDPAGETPRVMRYQSIPR